jgi:hypothetical protein
LSVPTAEQELVINCKEQSLVLYLDEQEILTLSTKEKLSVKLFGIEFTFQSFEIFGQLIVCQTKQSDGATCLMCWYFSPNTYLKKVLC